MHFFEHCRENITLFASEYLLVNVMFYCIVAYREFSPKGVSINTFNQKCMVSTAANCSSFVPGLNYK